VTAFAERGFEGPKPPKGKESNWLETIPGKSWFTILRMYGPLQPWFDKTDAQVRSSLSRKE